MSAPAGVPEDLETLSAMLEDMGEDVERVAEQVIDQWEAGLLTLAAAIAALSIVVQTAIRQAGIVGAAHTAASLTAHGLRPAATLPASALASRLEPARLTAAAASVLEDNTDPRPAARRLAHTETAHAAREAQISAAGESPDAGRVIGWRRVLDSDACPTCRAWSAGGRVLPLSSKMATHPNCDCTRELVYADE